ncbi:hypothetical protein [Micromonospora sp. NPDC049102]|uniref:maltokinase N-terminal cap-like domain-containing protein n=1 Tax=Micromonospora sp. NPDC049102 TaxID=3364265 RepID=UPI0037213078
MALLHRATLHPTKLDLLTTWLPGRPWYQGPTGVEMVSRGAYRFDDPAGEVGIETILVAAGDGPVHQVPLTYRAAPLQDADEWLVGTMEHSALTHAVLSGAGQAEQYFEVDGRREVRPPTMTIDVDGGGDVPEVGVVRRVVDEDDTVIVTDAVELVVVRRPVAGAVGARGATLSGTWDGQSTAVPLAYVRTR